MALKEILAAYTFDVSGIEKLNQADEKTTALTRSLKVLGGVVGAAAVFKIGTGLFDWVNGVADAADQTDKFATAIGASARDVAEWDMILGNAGVPLERARLGLKTFAKQAGEAARGNKDLQGTFSKLGVTTRDASGQLRPLNDRMTDAVLGLSKIVDPARRAATAEKLFGEAGLGFVRVALDGAGALEAQRREFDELHGGGSYEQFVKNSKEAAVANDKWRNATAALRVVIAGALVPALTAVVTAITRVTLWVSKMVSGTKAVQVTLITLGAVAAAFAIKMAIAFAPALATVGLFVAAIGAAVLLIEDLYQLFTGGESLIGRWIDSMLGAGEAEKLVGQIKEGIRDLIEVFRALDAVARPIIDGIRKAVRALADAIESVLADLDKAARSVAKRTGVTAGVRALVGGAQRQIREAEARGEAPGELRLSAGTAGAAAAAAAQQAGIRGGEEAARLFAPSPQEIQATVAQRLTPFGVTVNSPTQITVQGAADPETTAQRILEELDKKQQDDLRRARDALEQR